MDPIEVYRRFAPYYDDYVGGFQADLPLYLELCRHCDPIAEIGCGTGRVLQPLLDGGHTVLGVDISEEMLEIARTKLQHYLQTGKLTLVNHNLCGAALPKKYPMVLATYYTFNYLIAEPASLSFLQSVHESLLPQGTVVLDLFYPQTLANPAIENRWQSKTLKKNGRSVLFRQKRQLVQGLETRIQIFREGTAEQQIVTNRRYYSKLTIGRLLSQARFTNIRVSDGYDLAAMHELQPRESTQRSFVVIANVS